MKLTVTKVDIEQITSNDALELQNEIHKVTSGKLFFTDEYPRLKELFQLLNGAFNSSVNGVHHISNRS